MVLRCNYSHCRMVSFHLQEMRKLWYELVPRIVSVLIGKIDLCWDRGQSGKGIQRLTPAICTRLVTRMTSRMMIDSDTCQDCPDPRSSREMAALYSLQIGSDYCEEYFISSLLIPNEIRGLYLVTITLASIFCTLSNTILDTIK